MDKFKMVFNFANKQTNLGFGLVALLTAGGEQIFSTVVFRCPCNGLNFVYGLVFLLVPALALFILGFILSKKTWRLVTGLCRDGRCSQSSNRSCHRVLAFGKAVLQVASMALLAPWTWIAVALLNGNFIECAMTGTNLTMFNNHLCKGTEKEAECLKGLHMFPCGLPNDVPKEVRDAVLLTLRSESQVVGWLLISSIILLHLCVSCLVRCCSPVSYLQLKFWRLYAQEESSALDDRTAAHAKELAKRNVHSFFSGTPPDQLWTPPNWAWGRISSLYRYKSKEQVYSTLHRFVESEQVEVAQGEGDLERVSSLHSTGSHRPAPAVLNFVDDGMASL